MSTWKPFLSSICLLAALACPRLHAQAKAPPPYRPAANADEAVKRIEELGGVVRRVAPKDDTLEVDFRNSTVTDAHLQYLQSLKMVTVVRLRDTPITDAGLLHLGKIATLKRLHLEKTAVTDAGMKHLTGLKELELLNLFGTEVSDAGLEHLKNLPRLKSLFVFQTKVTVRGSPGCKKRFPDFKSFPTRLRIVSAPRRHGRSPGRLSTRPRRNLPPLKKDAEELAPTGRSVEEGARRRQPGKPPI